MLKFFIDHAGKIFVVGSIIIVGGAACICLAPLSAATMAIVTTATYMASGVTVMAGSVALNEARQTQIDKMERERRELEKQENALELNKTTISGETVEAALKRLDANQIIDKAAVSKNTLEIAAIKKLINDNKNLSANELMALNQKIDDLNMFRGVVMPGETESDEQVDREIPSRVYPR